MYKPHANDQHVHDAAEGIRTGPGRSRGACRPCGGMLAHAQPGEPEECIVPLGLLDAGHGAGVAQPPRFLGPEARTGDRADPRVGAALGDERGLLVQERPAPSDA